ncbi:DUF5677 domain-containing protein [Bordetella bronchiseptica]|uniref:DUF5677 domain-containing protein n=1 Tax=Bordetella bronchiseptica TaxID=518 RepID=UPI001243E50A|nr:DUF5677 domain-containing protein [Bordetella bronchiseptica]KAB1448544.1 hypothetical protein F7D00_08410 [Bordetella bronchiseptica]KAB1574866.1 hypothetical protein F7890_08410 [Bordetella bronchiseptica]
MSTTTTEPLLTLLESIFKEAMEKLAKEGRQIPDTLQQELFNEQVEILPEQQLAILLKNAPQMLKEHRSLERGFQARSFRRWRGAFDLFETIIVMCSEVCEANELEGRQAAIEGDDFIFEALSGLAPRALLVAREILCLLRGGYADGALSRWRTLHEITVTALFLASQNQEISFRYLASFAYQSRHAAKQLNKYADRNSIQPFSEEELADMEERCAHFDKRLNPPFKGGDYDWAAPALNGRAANFAHIEEAVGLDHWRPYYRWASQHTHSAHRPGDRLLGMSEAAGVGTLAGASNSGFVDPFQLTAHSLTKTVSAVLLYTPNLDRLVHVKILMLLVDRLAAAAIRLEANSLRRHRRSLNTTT